MELIIFLIAVIGTILLIFASMKVMNRFVKPVSDATEVMNSIADGDFTCNMVVKGDDEVARMSDNLQHFIEQMRITISEINSTADWINNQAVSNNRVSDSLTDASGKQIAEMDALSKIVEQLSDDTKMVSSRMEKLAQWIKMADDEGNNANDLMQESVLMSENGKKDMEQIDEGMRKINASISSLDEQINKVEATTAQIGNMVNLIMDIASETNLLSLNASIEAARAGEAGRGFAVVAEQIGHLAANSSVAADDIAKLTEEIKQSVGEAITHMSVSLTEVKANALVVSNAGETFEKLYVSVGDTGRRVNRMIELVNQIDDVAALMEEATRRQLQATADIARASKGMEENTRELAENSSTVAENAAQLKKEATVLSERMNKFRLK